MRPSLLASLKKAGSGKAGYDRKREKGVGSANGRPRQQRCKGGYGNEQEREVAVEGLEMVAGRAEGGGGSRGDGGKLDEEAHLQPRLAVHSSRTEGALSLSRFTRALRPAPENPKLLPSRDSSGSLRARNRNAPDRNGNLTHTHNSLSLSRRPLLSGIDSTTDQT